MLFRVVEGLGYSLALRVRVSDCRIGSPGS